MLGGMKVISFCHFLQGPACSQYLADMGAEVIKIEPLDGPFERHWSGAKVFVGGVSGFFLSANRNKKSFAVDLKSERGRQIVLDLVRTADVVVENFRTGVMERLGLSYDDLKTVKADIVYASGTGWGLEGPMVGKTAQDLIIQARSGLISATGPAGRPTAVGAAIVDQHAGALLAMGILGAILHRKRTGEGTHVQGSLLGAGFDLQTEPLTNYLSAPMDKSVFERQENLASWYHEAPYGVYRAQDCHIVIPTNEIGPIGAALECSELNSMASLDRYDHRDEIAAQVSKAIARFTYDEIAARFDTQKIWYGRVNTYDDLVNDAQIRATDSLVQVEVNGAPAILVNHPLRYNGDRPAVHTISTEPGSHTREILAALGRNAAEIEELIETDIVAAPENARKEVTVDG